ncbi:F-box/FBD/LRR-repeat protein At1g78750 [Ricinus communis]|uniref:F-box/FBD/LRR-repeat protein At1g78750 n=1 Tax=Ricinus communis TaxID=3988 RepID=UPI0007723D6D|nr:F-box/FBD/LRR-repeat protein At1g78750 [Ricinus communis]|eukprot:XP_015581873.1 F-box/FBD/LRR-repeat protein At1g78750 [Ricinus communis]
MDNLPDDLVSRILSFLPIRDVTRCRTISSRFGELGNRILAQSITIDSRTVGADLRKRRKYCFNLNRQWTELLRERNMGTLNLFWEFSAAALVERRNAIRWINYAAALKAKVMIIHLQETLYLPPSVYKLESLEYLSLSKITMMRLYDNEVRFGSLEVLSLCHVRVTKSPLLGEWISANCPRLRELNVQFVEGVEVLNVSSTSLEKFCIANSIKDDLHRVDVSTERLRMMTVWLVTSPDTRQSTSLRIAAQNLESLTLYGDILDEYRLGNLNNLQEAYLYYNGCNSLINRIGRTVDQNLMEIVRGVSQARRIFSHESFIEPLIERGLLQQLATFGRAESFFLWIQSPNLPFRIIASFVEALLRPNLRMISITYTKFIVISPEGSFFRSQVTQMGTDLMQKIIRDELEIETDIEIDIDDDSDFISTVQISFQT